jgi:hypothetical protein
MAANHSLVERVAGFADIDTRRALGVPPGKIAKYDFVPWPIAPTTFRYFSATRKLLYINFDEAYDVFCWEVYDDIEPMGTSWQQRGDGLHRGVWRGLDDFVYFNNQKVNVEIFDNISGTKVYITQNLQPGTPIYLGNLLKGTYLIKVTSQDNKIVKQFRVVKL